MLHGNIEVILVDDGSPDKSGYIIDRLKEEDNRIVVIHQENHGVSSARNAGMAVASGEYITFVDGDDWVDANYVTYRDKERDRYRVRKRGRVKGTSPRPQLWQI